MMKLCPQTFERGSVLAFVNYGREGWTQAEMAYRFGLDRSYIAEIETGKRNVCLLNLQVIADGFGMPIARLFSRL
jgi:transcriptional regulator with XRE-family HTH domain